MHCISFIFFCSLILYQTWMKKRIFWGKRRDQTTDSGGMRTRVASMRSSRHHIESTFSMAFVVTYELSRWTLHSCHDVDDVRIKRSEKGSITRIWDDRKQRKESERKRLTARFLRLIHHIVTQYSHSLLYDDHRFLPLLLMYWSLRQLISPGGHVFKSFSWRFTWFIRIIRLWRQHLSIFKRSVDLQSSWSRDANISLFIVLIFPLLILDRCAAR